MHMVDMDTLYIAYILYTGADLSLLLENDKFWLPTLCYFKGCRMGRSDMVSLWYAALLISTRFRFFYFSKSNC